MQRPLGKIPPLASSEIPALPDRRSGSTSADEPTRVSDVSAHLAPRTPQPPPLIEGYELHEEIHRGGQGVVYRATQLGTKRQVALKVLLEGPYASETARRRFEREVELAASLHHPHIVTILDSGISHGLYFFAMEFVTGARLDRFLEEKRPSIEHALDLFERICQAVNFAHQRGVIHRDLKPSNILIDHEGQPRLLDFGLAKTERGTNPQETTVAVLSQTGQVVGTLAYMSPEQAAGSSDVDVRSDVYSLGVIFYEALVGRTPYAVSGPLGEVLQRIANDDPIRPRSASMHSRYGAQLDDELETILLKALEKEPGRRYQTAGELAKDLAHYVNNEPIEAKRASALYMLRKTLRRYRWQAGAVGAFLLLIFGFLGTFIWLYQAERTARAETEKLRTVAAERADKAASAARAAEDAGAREKKAREEAESNQRDAESAALRLRRALVRQKIQQGELAQQRGDLGEARVAYWDAWFEWPGNAAADWSLRQYYSESGEVSSTQIGLGTASRLVLSPGGTLAAGVELGDTILVHDIAAAAVRASFVAPGPIEALTVSDDGVVAAAGRTWGRVWRVGQSEPSVVALWLDEGAILSAGASKAGDALLVCTAKELRSHIGKQTQPKMEAPWRGGGPIRALELDPAGDRFAVLAGERVTTGQLRAGGEFALDPPARVTGSARCARFDGDRLLVLANGLQALALSERSGEREATRVMSISDEYDAFAWNAEGQRLLLGAEDGRIAVLRSGSAPRMWSSRRAGLVDVRWNGEYAVTLDARGSLTRWSPQVSASGPQTLLTKSAPNWAIALDGSFGLFAASDGQLTAWNADGREGPRSVSPPGIVDWITGRRPEDMRLAVSGDGQSAMIATGGRISLFDVQNERWLSARWNESRAELRRLALSADGHLAAIQAEATSGDSQSVTFFHVDRGRARNVLSTLTRPVELSGSPVRDMLFLPHSDDLILARANGGLSRMHSPPVPERPTRSLEAAPRNEPLVTLESPANLVATDRAGRLLAVACDDGMLRLLAMPDAAPIGMIPMGRAANAIAFDSTGDALLVQSGDGQVAIYEVATLEPIANWTATVGPAGWVGKNDSILFAQDERVVLRDRPGAPQMRAANESAALQRSISRQLLSGQYEQAWAAISRLEELDAARAETTRELIVERALRRKGGWAIAYVDDVTRDAQPELLLRLGRAAVEGGYFGLGQNLLERGIEAAGGAVDTISLLRRAECRYLLGRPEAAVAALREVSERDDLHVTDLARVYLELAAAAALSDSPEYARKTLVLFEARVARLPAVDLAGVLATRLIGSVIVGQQSENELATGLAAVLKLVEGQWVEHRDDLEFFMAELARRNGDIALARQRYQRCIDIARDEWPSGWARYRLAQLGATVQ